MPAGWDEFTPRELGAVLGVSAGDAEEILGLAQTLEVHLPGTRAAFRAGVVTHEKAAIIAWATALLDPAEARAAEALRKAGLEGGMGQLRACAYLDILLGTDSRPLGGSPDRTSAPDTRQAATPAPAGPVAGVIPPGIAAGCSPSAVTFSDLWRGIFASDGVSWPNACPPSPAGVSRWGR